MAIESQTFNDGLCEVFSVEVRLDGGNQGKEFFVSKGRLRFDERTVGINRYNQFLQNGVSVARMLRVPRKLEVSPQDVIIPLNDQPYKVVQVQYPKDVLPQSMDLSLERVTVKYERR